MKGRDDSVSDGNIITKIEKEEKTRNIKTKKIREVGHGRRTKSVDD